jgi:hypothetical protein
MENISNAKIEKLKAGIVKSKAKIAEYQAKLKEQEKLLVTLEDLEIVARFRSQNGNEDLAAKLRNDRRNPGHPRNEVSWGGSEPARVFADSVGKVKEEATNDSVQTE